MRISIGVASAALCLACGCVKQGAGPLTPQEALESFRIASGFRIELFAAEPHVVDPVEMVFDEHGGVYVAELGDNPDDPPEGQPPLSRIKYLEDTDGDGRIDRHTVFADRLLAVEGIAPWRGGLIATAAPDVLYLKDTDGDRRADVREILYTGFALGHVEGRLSNPRLGMDNWVYVVNHRYPGSITSPADPGMPPVEVRNREFRFHPLRGLAEPSPGDAQFGQSFNRWGHRFITHNTVHLRHTVVPPGYLERNPLYAPNSADQDISDHGRPAAPVFAISRPQQWRVERTRARQRRYAVTRPERVEHLEGVFTAAAGTTVYDGDRFGAEFEDAIFVGEGNGNLVHCDLVRPSGVTYTAARWPESAEFLASADNWFRPVNFSNAPDGYLYLLDYYREFHEHPDFIPEPVQRRLKMDFRSGDELGRIYRIVPDRESGQLRPARLAGQSGEDLVRNLAHPNGWHRRTAHRLLLERQDKGVAPSLRELASSHKDAAVRLRSLWVLEGLDSLGSDSVVAALSDPHPAVREAGLRLAEQSLGMFAPAVLEATRDENPRVAFQAALTAGNLPAGSAAVRALAAVLARFPEEPWLHIAVLSAPPELASPMLVSLAEEQTGFLKDPSPQRSKFVRGLARVVGSRNDSGETDRTLALVAGTGALSMPVWASAALNGLADGLALHGDRVRSGAAAVLGSLLRHQVASVRASAARLAPFFEVEAEVQRAIDVAADPAASLGRRMEAAGVLQAGTFNAVAMPLAQLIRDHPEPDLRVRAARALASFPDAGAADILLESWDDSPPDLRDAVADSLMRRRDHALALVAAVGAGRVLATDIPAITRIRLSQHPDDGVRAAAAQNVLPVVSDRDQVLADRLPALGLDGSLQSGEDLFDRECASCHSVRAARGRIGPDLSGVANRSQEDLLTSILDPSYAIEDRYRNHIVETIDGRFYDGILRAETSLTITLRGEREDITVLKQDVAGMRISSVSLMPEGFEETFSDQELADLIAYLQAGL